MKFLFFLTFLLISIGLCSAQSCPEGFFTNSRDQCAKNVIVGGGPSSRCPADLKYDVNTNTCIQRAS